MNVTGALASTGMAGIDGGIVRVTTTGNLLPFALPSSTVDPGGPEKPIARSPVVKIVWGGVDVTTTSPPGFDSFVAATLAVAA